MPIVFEFSTSTDSCSSFFILSLALVTCIDEDLVNFPSLFTSLISNNSSLIYVSPAPLSIVYWLFCHDNMFV